MRGERGALMVGFQARKMGRGFWIYFFEGSRFGNVVRAFPRISTDGVRRMNGAPEVFLFSCMGRPTRSTKGVKLLGLEDQDKVAAAVVIPPEEVPQPEEGTLLQ
jgi:hypothetical protein